jgi:hypothetical protein
VNDSAEPVTDVGAARGRYGDHPYRATNRWGCVHSCGSFRRQQAWFDRNQRERFSRTKETKMQVRLTVENEVVWHGSINGFFAANGIAADEANTIIANLTEKGEHAFGGGAGPLFILS